MRLSVSKRSNPFREEEMNVDHGYGEHPEEPRLSTDIQSNRWSKHKESPENLLNWAKVTCSIHNDSHMNIFTKMMESSETPCDLLSKWDKIYSCSVCPKQFKLYDLFNDDLERLFYDEKVELIDEITFRNNYICPEWDMIAWPSWTSKRITDSQSTCNNCFRID